MWYFGDDVKHRRGESFRIACILLFCMGKRLNRVLVAKAGLVRLMEAMIIQAVTKISAFIFTGSITYQLQQLFKIKFLELPIVPPLF
jgi:hypothetical protein